MSRTTFCKSGGDGTLSDPTPLVRLATVGRIELPNFYEFESLVRRAMAEPVARVGEFARELSSLEPSARPRRFKGKSQQDLLGWLTRGHTALRRMFGSASTFTTTADNQAGADLAVVGTGQQVELKTGEVTDANVGLSAVAWALGDKSVDRLHSIMSTPMKERRDLALRGDLSAVRKSKEETMARLRAYFLDRLTVGESPPPFLELYVRAVAHGVTKQKDVAELTGTPEGQWRVPVVLHADWEAGWVRVTNPFGEAERIVVEGVFLDPRDRAPDGVARAHVRLKGSRTGRTALLYPNFKNAYKSKGLKVEAQHWVKNACFHIWIDR